MDPLSDILSLLRPNSYGFRGLDAGGDWLLAFARDDGIKCYAIQSGSCWLAMEGEAEPVLLEAGDFVLLPGGQAFRLYSAADAPPIDAFDFFPAIPAGETAVLNGGGDVSGMGGYFGFEGMHAELLLGMLPPVVHKHVLCEKPMATNVTDAQRMIDACKRARRKLMIAYRCQYLPEYRTLIEMARGQSLGALRLIEASNGQNNADNGQWRLIPAMSGGGSLPDVGVYCLNAARFITGEEPVEITARTLQPKNDPRFREVEDLCAFTLRFPSGVLATCSSGYSYHENRFLRVMGTEAWAGLDPAFGYDNLTMQIGRRSGMSAGLEQRRWSPKNQFALEMDAFADAIMHDRIPLTPGEEGLQDMRVIEAIYQAAASGSIVRMAPSAKLDATRGPPPAQES